ncbi:MAG: polymerase sigma-70 factor, sigma-E family protein [Frankiales bacterium]|nr:polymerase sigma-70 factor, sigma-E family protein [Frankiales bacterium]
MPSRRAAPRISATSFVVPPLFSLLTSDGSTAAALVVAAGGVVATTSVLVGVAAAVADRVAVARGRGLMVRVAVGPGPCVNVGCGVGLTVSVAVGLGVAVGLAQIGITQGAAIATAGRARSMAPHATAPASREPTRKRTARGYERFLAPSANLAVRLSVGTHMRAGQATAGGWPVTELASEQAGADDLLTGLYTTHYRELVRLAGFLTGDRDNAEEVVQDAYVKVHGSWRGLRDPAKAEAYLRTAVVNLSRSRLRRRQVVAKHQPEPLGDVASAESHALQTGRRDAVLDALRQLPRRQREAVALRYYGDLTEAQTAAAMGCSVGAVKSHTSRAMAALRPLLEDER